MCFVTEYVPRLFKQEKNPHRNFLTTIAKPVTSDLYIGFAIWSSLALMCNYPTKYLFLCDGNHVTSVNTQSADHS